MVPFKIGDKVCVKGEWNIWTVTAIEGRIITIERENGIWRHIHPSEIAHVP